MTWNKYWNSKLKKLDWTDISLTKLSVFAFALLIAKLWIPILNLEWYWYAIVFVITATKPIMKIFN